MVSNYTSKYECFCILQLKKKKSRKVGSRVRMTQKSLVCSSSILGHYFLPLDLPV